MRSSVDLVAVVESLKFKPKPVRLLLNGHSYILHANTRDVDVFFLENCNTCSMDDQKSHEKIAQCLASPFEGYPKKFLAFHSVPSHLSTLCENWQYGMSDTKSVPIHVSASKATRNLRKVSGSPP